MPLEVNQTGRRYSLGMLDEAVERTVHLHQAGELCGMHIGNGAGQGAMRDLAPLFEAALLQPCVQLREIRAGGNLLPQPSPCVLDVLIALTFLPPFRRDAEVRQGVVSGKNGSIS